MDAPAASPTYRIISGATLTERALDLPVVLGEWVARCAHVYGRNHVEGLSPWVESAEIALRLSWASALQARDQAGVALPAPELPDILPLLTLAARPDAILAGTELLRVLRVVQAQADYAACLHAQDDFLQQEAEALAPAHALQRSLSRALDADGVLLDSASAELGRLRQALRQGRDQISRQLQSWLRDPQRRDIWQDQTIVQRGGRYLLPLKAAFKGRIKSILHDRSASGETLFVEPLELVEQNNALAEMDLAERHEQERILRRLTAAVGAESQRMRHALALMGRLDAVRAGLELGACWAGTLPDLAPGPKFQLKDLRHPLLALRHPGQVVANDLALGQDPWQLLLSGPNTGGKTALLKAVGLAHVLGYLGLPIPATGFLGRFTQIHAVIGDSQDIQADLSTFSAQMQRVRGVLASADAQSLVLLDELGNGTDPREGAALAEAISTLLVERRAVTLLTSHMEQLKRHALGQAGVILGGMGFDKETLQPTWRLQLGVAGASQGLAIARRVGLPTAVLALAERLHGGQREDWEHWDRRREQLLREAETRLETVARLEEEARQLRRQLADEEQRARQAREQAQSEAQNQWRKVLDEARRQVRESIAALKQGRNTQAVSSTLEQLDQQFQRAPQTLRPQLPAPGSRGLFLPLRVGVEVLRVDAAQGRMLVQLRGKQIWIDQDRFLPDAALELPKEVGRSVYVSPEEHSWRLDLRGQRRDVALGALQRHVDGAVAAGRQQVEILHGTGNGVLAQMVREFAQEDPRISAWRMARPEQGGGGVSELDLR